MKEINYYGTEDNYIHLKFGDARKCYNLTKEFRKKYSLFSEEYDKYWNMDKTCKFKNPFQIVSYVFENKLPVHFYYNYTDTPAKNKKEIMNYLVAEQSCVSLIN
jgi:hypothetical protein